MVILPYDQNSPEWDAARIGLPTASCFKKIMNNNLEPLKAPRKKYLYDLAEERVTGKKKKNPKLDNFDRGHEKESDSTDAYAYSHKVEVETVGLCYYDELRQFGASPDRLVGPDGGLETKDHIFSIQMEILEGNYDGSDHKLQCLGCMLVCGRDWWDLQNYCEFTEPHIIRFERVESEMAKMKAVIDEFVYDLNQLVKKYSR